MHEIQLASPLSLLQHLFHNYTAACTKYWSVLFNLKRIPPSQKQSGQRDEHEQREHVIASDEFGSILLAIRQDARAETGRLIQIDENAELRCNDEAADLTGLKRGELC